MSLIQQGRVSSVHFLRYTTKPSKKNKLGITKRVLILKPFELQDEVPPGIDNTYVDIMYYRRKPASREQSAHLAEYTMGTKELNQDPTESDVEFDVPTESIVCQVLMRWNEDKKAFHLAKEYHDVVQEELTAHM